jgi:hypothetical protein
MAPIMSEDLLSSGFILPLMHENNVSATFVKPISQSSKFYGATTTATTHRDVIFVCALASKQR